MMYESMSEDEDDDVQTCVVRTRFEKLVLLVLELLLFLFHVSFAG